MLVLTTYTRGRHSLSWRKGKLREFRPLAQGHTAWNCDSNLNHPILSPVFLQPPDFIDPKVLCLSHLGSTACEPVSIFWPKADNDEMLRKNILADHLC